MKKYIMGNWKMNMLPNETIKYIENLDEKLKTLGNVEDKVEVSLYVPYINMFYANLMSQETSILIGAQNVYHEDKGAFTGEISADMLKAIEIEKVLIGHSERRHVFNETNEDINKKIKKTQEKGMQAIFCIGETNEENEKGKTFEVLSEQIEKGLLDVDIQDIIVAYEPVWAIGTGKVCDSDVADDICKYIKEILMTKYGKEINVLYGGSVNTENAKEILEKENIDGVLVGGASLNADDFFKIITSTI